MLQLHHLGSVTTFKCSSPSSFYILSDYTYFLFPKATKESKVLRQGYLENNETS